ncbi:hypothetical protein ACTID9_27700 [Brevibacillus fluminis]|uniref:hypothetical protein n=1 Tax=Brevibacillus fluminis TaxID=511487 RepID=UPI003F8C12D6
MNRSSKRIALTVVGYLFLSLVGYWFIGVYQIIPLQFGFETREDVIATLVTHILYADYAFSCYFLGWFLLCRKDSRLKGFVYTLATIVVVSMYIVATKVSA